MESGFKRVINWNKYLPRPELLPQNPDLNYLIEPSFQGVNTLFALAFKNDAQRKVHSGYYLPNVEIKNYVMINGENVFDQTIKDNKVTYENIRKVATAKGDDALDADPRAIQQINFTAILTQYNSLNVKLSNSQLNKLKSAIKNGTDVVLRLTSNMVGNSNNETNFPHKLLLTNRLILSLRKAFANYTSVDIKL